VAFGFLFGEDVWHVLAWDFRNLTLWLTDFLDPRSYLARAKNKRTLQEQQYQHLVLLSY
jgi:hypothetical protein